MKRLRQMTLAYILALPLMGHWLGALSLAASRLPRRHSHGGTNSLAQIVRQFEIGCCPKQA